MSGGGRRKIWEARVSSRPLSASAKKYRGRKATRTSSLIPRTSSALSTQDSALNMACSLDVPESTVVVEAGSPPRGGRNRPPTGSIQRSGTSSHPPHPNAISPTASKCRDGLCRGTFVLARLGKASDLCGEWPGAKSNVSRFSRRSSCEGRRGTPESPRWSWGDRENRQVGRDRCRAA